MKAIKNKQKLPYKSIIKAFYPLLCHLEPQVKDLAEAETKAELFVSHNKVLAF